MAFHRKRLPMASVNPDGRLQSCLQEARPSTAFDARKAPFPGPFFGAGEGNRTLTTSLEGWSSTIELRPRSAQGYRFPE